MRILVFFDLPTETSEDRREYAKFRKVLIKSGFYMLQESVYAKLVLNGTHANTSMEKIRRSKPPRGLVQAMTITEKQFSRIEVIVGETKTDVLDSDERTVFL